MTKRSKAKQEAQSKVKELIAKVDQDPYDVHAYYDLGALLNELQSYTQAEELFKRALNVFEKQPEKQSLLRYGLGNVYYSSGLYSEAVAEFQQVKDAKLQADAYLMIGQAYFAQGNYPKAILFALTAVEKLKGTSSGYTLLGNSFIAMGDFQNADKYFKQALEIDSKDLEANFGRGIVAFVNGVSNNPYFVKVKNLNPDFYHKKEQQLVDIERFLQAKQDNSDKKKE